MVAQHGWHRPECEVGALCGCKSLSVKLGALCGCQKSECEVGALLGWQRPECEVGAQHGWHRPELKWVAYGCRGVSVKWVPFKIGRGLRNWFIFWLLLPRSLAGSWIEGGAPSARMEC